MLQCIDLLITDILPKYMINICNKAIGIDISKSSVKAVCVDESNVMDSYGIEDLPPNSGDTEVILALKKILSPDCYNCDVVIGLRGLDVLTKHVMLPQIDSVEEMEAKVEEEMKDLLPVQRSEVQLSWEVLMQTDNQIGAVLIAVPNKVIERYRRLVDGVGLNIKSLEVNALAIKRSLEEEMKENTMIVDIHADETDIEYYNNGSLLIDKTISMGGFNITRQLSRKLNMSIEEAELRKREGIQSPTEFDEMYKMTADDIISEVVKVISMLEIDYQEKPEEILLTGGDFNSKEFENYFVEKLSEICSVRVVVPRGIINSDNIDKKLSDKFRLTNALGLALK